MVNVVFVLWIKYVQHIIHLFSVLYFFIGSCESFYQYGSFDHGGPRKCWTTIHISNSVIIFYRNPYLFSNSIGSNNRLGLEKQQNRDDLWIFKYIISLAIFFNSITSFALLLSSTFRMVDPDRRAEAAPQNDWFHDDLFFITEKKLEVFKDSLFHFFMFFSLNSLRSNSEFC